MRTTLDVQSMYKKKKKQKKKLKNELQTEKKSIYILHKYMLHKFIYI